ncbi:GNAT family N-acetyltransferase [Microbispora sp. NBRC 16548]|uniref:GNAT family N-acetyltransferase n=1 Tax=Microbispora sp. NBRC 16548 TaxID=3030994 RepID=UPI001614136A|nr:GNAT family N-acetyltransferase [Microbispora sp. NBRC 16548]GLX09350.1 N-acetyltransferase [Microbispora sp. NBRC 16548]
MSFQLTRLVDPHTGASSHRLAWLASRPDGVPAGSAYLRLFTAAGHGHLAELDLHVHPAERRAGVGSRLLAAALAAAREEGRRCVTAEAEAGAPGEAFLAARGFRPALGLTFTRLALAGVDTAVLAAALAEPHPGYRLVSWEGVVPDELAETFAASRRAMDDMPMDGLDYRPTPWDVARVRGAAEAIARCGELLYTVAAVDADRGTIAGFTELVVPGDGTGDGQHYGTGVLPEHRGRGLGRRMKAEMIRLVRERHPDLGGLLADTADGNTYMRGINDALGYVPTHRTVRYRLDL